ncbi:MAG: hypothetical protein JWO38_1828 [Gemmataceae bacterium]|nr:hypothetical protein [Gemmataceae bacterium]
MNRFMQGAAAAALLAGGLGSVGCAGTGGSVARGAAPGGCATGDCGTGGCGTRHGDGAILRTYYDPCYPERYAAAARAEVLAPFAAQVNNGHVLNHTVWNWYFEPGTDKLTTAGLAKLDSIAHTRPGPDNRLYLQAARDVQVTPANMDRVAAHRDELTAKRAAMVLRYMNTQPTTAPVAYEIFVHDPVVPGISADFALSAYRGQVQGYRGGIGGGAGTTSTSTGGGGQTPAASAIGTGATGGNPSGPPAPAPGTPGAGGPGM